MAARFAHYGGKWWGKQGQLAAIASGAAACSVAARSPKASQAEAKDSGPQGKACTQQIAANLQPYHLATWQSGSCGLVKEREVNKFLNPMAVAWPEMNFLNPDELVMGHIILNDSKKASRPGALSEGCVRGNACKDVYFNPGEVKAAIVTCGGL
ncbi:unnamed protein product, partial [Polarella glacialis]